MGNDLSAALAAHLESAEAATTDSSDTAGADTFGQLARLVQDVAGVEADSLSRESSLKDLSVASLALVELTIRAEEKFGVRFEESTVLAFETLGDVVDFIQAER